MLHVGPQSLVSSAVTDCILCHVSFPGVVYPGSLQMDNSCVNRITRLTENSNRDLIVHRRSRVTIMGYVSCPFSSPPWYGGVSCHELLSTKCQPATILSYNVPRETG